MATTNDVTGDKLVSKKNSDKFRSGHERLFGKSKLELRLEAERKAKAEKK